jgi:3-oxoacyl-[acyl-carrier-protein] synthase-1
LGATGVHEAIYSLIMMNKSFIAASANIETLDPALDPSEIVTKLRSDVSLDSVLSNSFGFGGTNATLVMSKYLD